MNIYDGIDRISHIPLPLDFGNTYKGKLYLGPLINTPASFMTAMEFNDIKTIISIGFKPIDPSDPIVKKYNWFCYTIQDNRDDTNADLFSIYLQEIDTIIHNSLLRGDNVYVHCRAGVSRSSTAIAYFFKQRSNATVDQIIGYLQHYRPCVNPNPRFVQLLKSI
jgi:hypothetical protein